MRKILAILLGKTITYFTKLLKIGGGSAAPGLYALKICPTLVSDLSKNIKTNIIITGTNGKTTTAKILSHFAKEANLTVIRNHTGSNLERGIASTLISNYTLYPKRYTLDLGIWELDEAAFNSVALKLNPDVIIFLNVFRDQLDRYGEIDTIVKKWCKTLENIPSKTKVLINGYDANLLKLKPCFKGKLQTFGIKDFKIKGEAKHVGNSKLDFEAINIKLIGLKGSSFVFKTINQQFPIILPLPGLYQIYNALAATACAINLNLPVQQITNALKNFTPAFGRVEKLPFGYIFLIKNPVGSTQVFQTLAPNIKPQDRLLLALNDNLADGTDVSWIWDADFEKLKIKNLKFKIICTGTRAYDLALRLKYADIPVSMIEPDLEIAFKQARHGLKGKVFILPTYTAMLELQAILASLGIKKHYWKESD